ncbi:MAG: prepilin-type N-terminal cleavage/methylation domain-containing protein [Acidobacteria bacterium]|nr:prepilin-type N-terminal cleavage/methylation domain-containing protein [Acidobacteriota bacterium]MBI3655958.1 prepilin-type N-terminal cleavage/methylation domain-containing protein [Acidobacteriota bacterium]
MRNHAATDYSRRPAPKPSAGFSLIELMVAMVILLIGLLSMASLVLGGVAASMQAKDLAIANQLAREAMEGVFTARISGNLTFDQLRSDLDGGIFDHNYLPINVTGPDGLTNTVPYSRQPVLQYIDPGKNGIYETPPISDLMPYATTAINPMGDDVIITFDRFQRQIEITNYPGDSNLRRVTINVRFTTNNLTSVVSTSTVISSI